MPSGEFKRYIGATMPQEFSPCGVVLERGKALMMRAPVHYYPYLKDLHVTCHCGLFVPFSRGGKRVGTMWIVAHRDHTFTADQRAVCRLELVAEAAEVWHARMPLGTAERP